MNLRAIAAVGVACAIFGAGWTLHGWRHRAELAEARQQHQADREAWAEGARQAAEQYRAIEAARAAAHREIVDDAHAHAQRLARDLAAARAAAGGLRDAAAAAAARACAAPGDPAAAGGGAPARSSALVLADVLGRADAAAGELAAAADHARAAGAACERAYGALIPHP